MTTSATEQATLNLLEQIATNTYRNSGEGAKKLGEGGFSTKNFEASISGLDKLTKNLILASKAQKENTVLMKEAESASRELNKFAEAIKNANISELKLPDKFIKSLKDLDISAPLKAVSNELRALKGLGNISASTGGIGGEGLKTEINKVADKLRALGDKDIDQLADNISSHANALNSASNIGDEQQAISDISKETHEYMKNASLSVAKDGAHAYALIEENNRNAANTYNEQRLGYLKSFFKTLGKGLKITIGGALQRMTGFGGPQGSGILSAFQESGFDLGTGSQFLQTNVAAAGLGASPEEALGFGAKYRNPLAALTGDAMITAEEGLTAAQEMGMELTKVFGAGNTIERLGTMFNTLTQFGIPIEEGFGTLQQTIKDISRQANVGTEVMFAAFDELANDKSFRSLFSVGDNQLGMLKALTESWTALNEVAIITVDEFVALNKRIGEQSKKGVVSRIVESAYAGRLADMVGLTSKEKALFMKGTRSPLALSADVAEGEKFSEQAQMRAVTLKVQKRGGKAQREAHIAEKVNTERLWEVMFQRSGFEGDADPILRGMTQDVDVFKELNRRRMEASKEEVATILELNSQIQKWLVGVTKSAAGPGAAFLASLGTFVANGIITAGFAVIAKKLGVVDFIAKRLGFAAVTAGGGATVTGAAAATGGGLIASAIKGAPVLLALFGVFKGLQASTMVEGAINFENSVERIRRVGLVFADAVSILPQMLVNMLDEVQKLFTGIDLVPDELTNSPFFSLMEEKARDERKVKFDTNGGGNIMNQIKLLQSQGKTDAQILSSLDVLHSEKATMNDTVRTERESLQKELDAEKDRMEKLTETLTNDADGLTENDKERLEIERSMLRALKDQLLEQRVKYGVFSPEKPIRVRPLQVSS